MLLYPERMSIEAIGDDRHPSEPATVRAAAEIRALMGRHNVVQQDLQRVLRLSQTGVSKRLRGLTPWDINELATVADFFHMPLSDLVAAWERPHPDGPATYQRRAPRSRLTHEYLSHSVVPPSFVDCDHAEVSGGRRRSLSGRNAGHGLAHRGLAHFCTGAPGWSRWSGAPAMMNPPEPEETAVKVPLIALIAAAVACIIGSAVTANQAQAVLDKSLSPSADSLREAAATAALSNIWLTWAGICVIGLLIVWAIVAGLRRR